MKIFLIIVYIFISALVFAALEIQIEGKNGWAAKLPTFRIKNKIMGVRPLTGYHLFFILFTLIIFHFPVFFLDKWSSKNEFLVLGSWILMETLEDFLWFAINPDFGLKKFNNKNPDLWWYKSWFLGLPSFYWYTFPIGLIFIALSL
jgi:hypothetical protein